MKNKNFISYCNIFHTKFFNKALYHDIVNNKLNISKINKITNYNARQITLRINLSSINPVTKLNIFKDYIYLYKYNLKNDVKILQLLIFLHQLKNKD